ncbi:MAG: hypothetical protein PSU94_17605 [Lacunisphaera sp.]|nr:hypothetical protein [Lacunisphaera sp.]
MHCNLASVEARVLVQPTMYPPKLIKPYVVSFCRSIVRDPTPRFVPVRSRPDAEVRSCFTTVARQVQESGGQMSTGWAIWEWPDVIIEGEYHCVWLSPSGDEIDITPKDPAIKRILFLPDAVRPYGGFQRDNFRKVLCKDKDVLRMAELGRLIHEELNRGELKHQHGEVVVRIQYARYQEENAAIVARLAKRYGHRLAELAKHSV